MDMRGYQQYKEQSVSTMTQGELLLLVLDELVKRVTRAELALSKKDYALFEASLDRSAEIVRYLTESLDRQYSISAELGRLYEFFGYEFSKIKAGRKADELKSIKPLITDLRDSFRMAEKKSPRQK